MTPEFMAGFRVVVKILKSDQENGRWMHSGAWQAMGK